MANKSKKKADSNGFQKGPPKSPPPDIPAPMDSPLQLFGEAKDRINTLYCRLDKFVVKATDFYSDEQLDKEVLKDVNIDRFKRLSKSIDTIKSVLSRNQMKVAFFGRTSNGKSTVINAILHDKVLPMGYGHTTGCFLQIQGNPNHEAFLEIQRNGQSEKQPIQSVSHIANALNTDSLEYSTLVKIYWPISKCPLLKYDVVLVDSPGVDVEENLDDWIDEHCHDADVFVLVSNAESTLNIAEKNFFHKVSEKLSKPNIFIVNNRWDSIAEDPDSMDQVRLQHLDRAVNFLSDELKINSREEAERRTFFVSARETLASRSSSQNTSSNTSNSFREGHDARDEDFRNFERCFEESLSKSAVQTKFKKHTDRGKETVNELSTILKSTLVIIESTTHKKIDDLQRNEARLGSLERAFYSNERALRDFIVEIKNRVHLVADSDFETEIRRLSSVVEDFELEFSPNPVKLRHYKEQLYLHVEEMLSENLRSKINTVIHKHVNGFNKEMSGISMLLSENRQRSISESIASQIYIQDELFDLKVYKQFYSEFQEDLEFRFSLGLGTILRKFQSKSGVKPINGMDQSEVGGDFLSMVDRFFMSPPQSPTTVGSLAVGGILVRTVGWKVIIITSVVYGALYAYEYLTWTNSAKERTFKAQYVRFAKKGLQDCVPIISKHIANSVEQKLIAVFNRVKNEVDEEHTEINQEVSLLRGSLKKLRVCEDFTRQLIGENDVLMTEFVAFASSFLHF